jgi:TolB-like protein
MMRDGGVVLGSAILALSAVTRPLEAQARPVVIAVLPFHDRGSFGQAKEVFEALELGIPATISAELRNHSELRLVDQERVNQALRQARADSAGLLDAATAALVGKEVGARYAVTGNFADFYGKFRLDARIIDVPSAQILRVVSNSDPQLQNRSDLHRIVQRVAHKVLAQANPSAPIQEGEGKAIPTEALVQFSLGLLAETRGDPAKARRSYNQALAKFPGYPDARSALLRLHGP